MANYPNKARKKAAKEMTRAEAIKRLKEEEAGGFQPAIKEHGNKRIKEAKEAKETEKARYKGPTIHSPSKNSRAMTPVEKQRNNQIAELRKRVKNEISVFGASEAKTLLHKLEAAEDRSDVTGPEWVELINDIVNIMGGGLGAVKTKIRRRQAPWTDPKYKNRQPTKPYVDKNFDRKPSKKVDIGLLAMAGLPPIKLDRTPRQQKEFTEELIADGTIRPGEEPRNFPWASKAQRKQGEAREAKLPGRVQVRKKDMEARKATEEARVKPLSRYKNEGSKRAGDATRARAKAKRDARDAERAKETPEQTAARVKAEADKKEANRIKQRDKDRATAAAKRASGNTGRLPEGAHKSEGTRRIGEATSARHAARRAAAAHKAAKKRRR